MNCIDITVKKYYIYFDNPPVNLEFSANSPSYLLRLSRASVRNNIIERKIAAAIFVTGKTGGKYETGVSPGTAHRAGDSHVKRPAAGL
jgi:hypothetical protein